MEDNRQPVALGIVLLMITVIGAIIVVVSVDSRGETYQRSCMESVHEPDPEATDYDRQALEFSTQIRKCMRG